MALPFPLPHRVKIEALSVGGRDDAGGNETTAETAQDGVPCLISQGSGRPDQRFEQPAGASRYTVTGEDPNLARMDVRFTILEGPRAGKKLAVVGVSEHGGIPGVFAGTFYRATCEEYVGG